MSRGVSREVRLLIGGGRKGGKRGKQIFRLNGTDHELSGKKELRNMGFINYLGKD